ncbi:MAG: Lrp/AsnC family transcriptional regulator, partial [Candidatus Altiarchaeota archaeon]|nr:Lrp/AsnC family transcriptional regulator [Candidatus Altiarchaeota archaeon]
KEREILSAIKDLSEVKDANIIYGEWDVVVKIDVKDVESITSFVVDKLRKIDAVKLTSTMIVAE